MKLLHATMYNLLDDFLAYLHNSEYWRHDGNYRYDALTDTVHSRWRSFPVAEIPTIWPILRREEQGWLDANQEDEPECDHDWEPSYILNDDGEEQIDYHYCVNCGETDQ